MEDSMPRPALTPLQDLSSPDPAQSSTCPEIVQFMSNTYPVHRRTSVAVMPTYSILQRNFDDELLGRLLVGAPRVR